MRIRIKRAEELERAEYTIEKYSKQHLFNQNGHQVYLYILDVVDASGDKFQVIERKVSRIDRVKHQGELFLIVDATGANYFAR